MESMKDNFTRIYRQKNHIFRTAFT